MKKGGITHFTTLYTALYMIQLDAKTVLQKVQKANLIHGLSIHT